LVRATRVVGALIVAVGVAVAASGFYIFYSGEQYVSFFVTAAGTALAYGGIALYLREPRWGAGLPPGATPSQATKYCRSCGLPLPAGAAVCPKCGSKQ
jgi:hypothetical protein